MHKIPTLFLRNPEKMSEVLPVVHPLCQWVLEGEGVATRKLDGTCCRVDILADLWKRRTVRQGKAMPEGFELCEIDSTTGKSFGWVRVVESDKWHIEARNNAGALAPGTYELVGPKIQGNPENYPRHTLVSHHCPSLLIHELIPRTFDGLREDLPGRDIEGIVFQHPDGRMAEIKLSDFGLKRGS